MKSFINKIILTISAIIITITGMSVKADTRIQSGIYSMKNSVYHESELGMSMSRSYLDENMQAKITKDGVVFTIGFSGTQYMNNYRIKINGSEVPVQIVEENKEAGTIKLQAEAPSTDVKISTAIYVDPMGRDVEFDIIPDYTSMVLLEAIEEAPEVVEVENISEEVVEEESTNETVENNTSKYMKIAIAAVGIVVISAALTIVLKKKK